MLKAAALAAIFCSLTACKFVEDSNREAVARAAEYCASQGFSRVSVTYMFGVASAYHTCLNSKEVR